MPSETICAETGDAISQLREMFNDVRTGVASSVLPEELPEGDASLSDYKAAWESSIKRQQTVVINMLREFLQVYSDEDRYMKALERPLAEAEALLIDFIAGTADNVETDHFALFLRGVKADLSQDQDLVYQIEDNLEDKFPPRAISGLIQNKYAIRPLEEEPETDAEEPSPSIGAESSDAPQEEQPVIDSDEFPERVIDMTLEEFAARYAPPIEEAERVDNVEETEEPEELEDQPNDPDQQFDFSELDFDDDEFDLEEETNY